MIFFKPKKLCALFFLSLGSTGTGFSQTDSLSIKFLLHSIFPSGTMLNVVEKFEPENKKKQLFRYKLYRTANGDAVGLEYIEAPKFPRKKILVKGNGQDIWTRDEPMGRLRKKSRHQFAELVNYNGYTFEELFFLPLLNDSLELIETKTKDSLLCRKYLNPYPDYEEYVLSCADKVKGQLTRLEFLNRYSNKKASIEFLPVMLSDSSKVWELFLEAEKGLSRIRLSSPKDTLFPSDFKQGLSLN